jgi:hypothetical protein
VEARGVEAREGVRGLTVGVEGSAFSFFGEGEVDTSRSTVRIFLIGALGWKVFNDDTTVGFDYHWSSITRVRKEEQQRNRMAYLHSLSLVVFSSATHHKLAPPNARRTCLKAGNKREVSKTNEHCTARKQSTTRFDLPVIPPDMMRYNISQVHTTIPEFNNFLGL